MSFFRSWFSYRRFNQLSPDKKRIVFYSESKQDWHHLAPIIHHLTHEMSRTVCYVTSDVTDFDLRQQEKGVLPFYIKEGLLCIWFFQMLNASVMVLTMMDLQNFHLKRSVHPVHYVYAFHSLGSTHMVDNENSYDHYDTILCAGPHHIREIRKREELENLPPKQLVEHGYARLENLIEQNARYVRRRPADEPPVLLVAPTWGDQSLLNLCGERLVSVLLEAGYVVIVRPHYQTAKLSPQVVRNIKERFGKHPRFEYVGLMGEDDSLFRSDLLICDWSGMAIEYALGLEKPVLFVDVPRRVRNPKYQDLGLEPIEVAIRNEVGTVLAPDKLEEAPRCVEDLLSAGTARAGMAELRTRWVFNLGHSAENGALEIARIADEAQRTAAPLPAGEADRG